MQFLNPGRVILPQLREVNFLEELALSLIGKQVSLENSIDIAGGHLGQATAGLSPQIEALYIT
ncbi:hypothetical protein D3C84_1077170 [compost metagenome]